MDIINGKIAAFVNSKQVIINKGSVDGVAVGMSFGIKLVIPDVIDPDDPENVLSGVFYTKGKIKVNQTYDRMSFCSVIPETKYTSIATLGVQSTEVYPEIDAPILLDRSDWQIKVGDEVYLIIEKEEK